jgi:hypothetical protein
MTDKKRGREPGFVMSDAHRVKIQKSNILNALLEHVDGKREMSATQVTAGLGLLRKCLPDLTNVTVSGDEKNPLSIQIVSGVPRVEAVADKPNGKVNGHASH